MMNSGLLARTAVPLHCPRRPTGPERRAPDPPVLRRFPAEGTIETEPIC